MLKDQDHHSKYFYIDYTSQESLSIEDVLPRLVKYQVTSSLETDIMKSCPFIIKF